MEEKKEIRVIIIYYILLLTSVLLFNITKGDSAMMYVGYCISFLYFFCSLVIFPYKTRKNYFILGWMFFLSGLVTLILNSEHLFDSVKSIGINVNIIVPFLYMIILGAVSHNGISLNAINKILNWFSLICFGISLLTIILNINQLSLIFVFSGNAYSTVLKGFFPNKNMFGNFVAIGAIISIYITCIDKKKMSFFIAMFLSALTVLSLSRAAILLLGVFFVFFCMSSLKKDSSAEYKRLRYLIIFAIFLAFGFVVYMYRNDTFKEFIFLKVLRMDTGDAGRSSIHSMGYELLQQSDILHWLLGYGANGLEYRINYDLHSTYLNILLTGGIIKLVLFIVSLIYSFRTCKKLTNRMMKSFCFSCLVSYMIYSFFETVVFFELGLFHFVIFFIILFIPNTLNSEFS